MRYLKQIYCLIVGITGPHLPHKIVFGFFSRGLYLRESWVNKYHKLSHLYAIGRYTVLACPIFSFYVSLITTNCSLALFRTSLRSPRIHSLSGETKGATDSGDTEVTFTAYRNLFAIALQNNFEGYKHDEQNVLWYI